MANPRGQQRAKQMRDALSIEAAVEVDDPSQPAQRIRRDRLLARVIFDKALAGDMTAAKEINDRLDGKVPQALTGEDGGPLEIDATATVTIIQIPDNGRGDRT